MKKLLHVGPAKKGVVGPGFLPGEWQELRFDIDPLSKPDIVGDMCDMVAIESESIDAIFTSHTIEHVYPLDVKRNLEEYLRVLKPEGFLVLVCPDIQTAAKDIAEGRLLEPVYESNEGPISPIDIVFGYRGYFTLPEKRDFMSHRTGFTLPILLYCMRAVGFRATTGRRRLSSYEMWGIASKSERSEGAMERLARLHIPD